MEAPQEVRKSGNVFNIFDVQFKLACLLPVNAAAMAFMNIETAEEFHDLFYPWIVLFAFEHEVLQPRSGEFFREFLGAFAYLKKVQVVF